MEYRLRWESFQYSTKESMKDLYQKNDYTDYTVSQELIPHFLSTAVDLKIQGIDFEEKTLILKDLNKEDTSNSFDMITLKEMEIKQTADQKDNGSIPLHNVELKTNDDGDKNLHINCEG